MCKNEKKALFNQGKNDVKGKIKSEQLKQKKKRKDIGKEKHSCTKKMAQGPYALTPLTTHTHHSRLSAHSFEC
jgi:hypothetical protein